MTSPPTQLVSELCARGVLAGLEWHESCTSTNALATRAGRDGRAEIYAVLADTQTAGRGRLDRRWTAPPGTSLLVSLLVRPGFGVAPASLGLLPLLTGLALVESLGSAGAGLKWPNDLLMGGKKAAGVLVEAPGPESVVVGVGLNVDWRGIERPPELAHSTSLAEQSVGDVDRWQVFAGFARAFARRYAAWRDEPGAFLDAYRAHCQTLGRRVSVEVRQGDRIEGWAAAIDAQGALVVHSADGRRHRVTVGDVVHLRPQNPRPHNPDRVEERHTPG